MVDGRCPANRPAVFARYKAILRELSTSAFAAPKLTELVDAITAVGAGRAASPRDFLQSRAVYLRDLVAGFDR